MFYGSIQSLVSLCLLLLSGLVQVQVNVRHSSPPSTSSLWSPSSSRSSNFTHPSTEEIETRPFGEESYHLFLNNVTREMILRGKHGDGECQVVDSSTSTPTSSNIASLKKDGKGKAPIVINIWSTTPDGKLVLNQRKEITKRILPLNQPPPQEENSAENELDAKFSPQAGNATNRDVLLYLLEELVTTQKRLEDNRESEYLLNGFSSLELFPSTSSRPRPVLGMSPRQILKVELSNSTTSGEDSWTTVLDIMKLNTVQNISRASDESYDDENISSRMGYILGHEEQMLESLKIGNLTVGSRRLDRRLVQNLLNLTAGPEFSSTLALKPICVPTLKDEAIAPSPSGIDGGIPIPTSENADQLPGLPVFPGPGSDIGVALQDWWGYNDYEFKKVKQSKKKKDKGHHEEHHGWGHEEDHGWGHEEEHHKKKKHKHKDKHKKDKHKHKKKKHKHHESHHHHSKEEHHHHHHPAPQHGWGWQPPPQHHGWGWAPPPPPPPPVHHGWGWPQQQHHQEHHGWGHEEHHKEEEHHDKKHHKKHHKQEKKKHKQHKKHEKWKKKQHKKKEKHKKKAHKKHKKHHESEEKCHHGWGWDHKEGHHKGDHGWGWGHKEEEHGHGWGHKPEPPKQHGWGWGSYKEPPKKEHGWGWSWGPTKEESSKKPKQQTKKVAIRMPAPFEIGGWLGGSGHEEDDGYHEMELIPSDMFHHALTGMGFVALLLGPFVFIAGLCWLVSSMSRPAYVVHGGGRGWRRRMGLSAGDRDVDGGWGWGKYGDGDEQWAGAGAGPADFWYQPPLYEYPRTRRRSRLFG